MPGKIALCLISLLLFLPASAGGDAEEGTQKKLMAAQLYNTGYLMALLGQFEEAEKAIRIDHDFGNPYNDIGVYLMELGKEEEAIPYLEKAMRAKRYCCYQFPHFNMGRIYLKKKMYGKAREEFEKSLTIDPNYLPAHEALELLKEAGGKEI